MNNDKKELNPGELEQVNGGDFMNRNNKKRFQSKQTASETAGPSGVQEALKKVVVGTGEVVKSIANWFGGLFSGND